MLLLIDGHNLISALPDIALDDPNDEAKLVEKLKSYAARTGHRCVVVFDGGIPGGLSRDLSSGRVQAVFAAAARTNADRVLRERIREASDPGQVMVVSSDREVQAEAEARRMRVLSSEAFAVQLVRRPSATPRQKQYEDEWNVHLSPQEIEDWLRLFGQQDSGEEDG